ncbi:MAG: YwiC-like family protein [Halodesulfurarchaeum sp.]
MAGRRASRRRAYWWLPPVPSEHGARSMLAVALLTPLGVGFGRGMAVSARTLLAYLCFTLLATGVLFFREAVRRRLRVPAEFQRSLTMVALLEAVVIVLLVGVLVVLQGQTWVAGVLVLPGVLGDVWIRRRGYPIPMGGEIAGVLALSLAVPVGTIVLGMAPIPAGIPLYGLFVGFHALGLVRVKTARNRDADWYRLGVALDIGGHGIGVLLAGATWFLGWTGVASPLIFLAALGWAVWLVLREEAPPVRTLGKRERALSLLFVLGGPWLLP